MIDPVELTADLIRCPSVTPKEAGAIQLLDRILSEAGFRTTRVDRNGIANLFARFGDAGNAKIFGFNGHIDVVPTGPLDDWTMDPFGAQIRDGKMYGRGAVDMKSGVAAFVSAAIAYSKLENTGSIVITITGDEEGDALDGTTAILDWMGETGERMDVCLVGEPTCPEHMGQMMKIGRRGSMTTYVTATGLQGHSAYPDRARNPLHGLIRLLVRLAGHELDGGTDNFDPSTLAIVTVDTGNLANNVIPGSTRATINIRFNDAHQSDGISAWIKGEAEEVTGETGVEFSMQTKVSGESFLTPPGALSELVGAAVHAETGVTPEASTSGGTSDARFIRAHCPVVEFGLVGQSMHKADEHVEVAQITALRNIYLTILKEYFA